MNAGGHGSDMAACLVPVPLARPARARTVAPAGVDRLELPATGACSTVGPSQVVLEADLAVRPGGRSTTSGPSVTDIVKWRREHQPGGSQCRLCLQGPVRGDSAGRLIEAAGLKGFRLGTAQVSEKHANFIQADKGGRRRCGALMEHVRAVVKERSGTGIGSGGPPLGLRRREDWTGGSDGGRKPMTPPVAERRARAARAGRGAHGPAHLGAPGGSSASRVAAVSSSWSASWW